MLSLGVERDKSVLSSLYLLLRAELALGSQTRGGNGAQQSRCCSKPGFHHPNTLLAGGYLGSGALPARGSLNIPD